LFVEKWMNVGLHGREDSDGNVKRLLHVSDCGTRSDGVSVSE
jgi:hypothetical protein